MSPAAAVASVARMGMVGQFFLAVLVGVAAFALGVAVHEGFVALTIVTGLLSALGLFEFPEQ